MTGSIEDASRLDGRTMKSSWPRGSDRTCSTTTITTRSVSRVDSVAYELAVVTLPHTSFDAPG